MTGCLLQDNIHKMVMYMHYAKATSMMHLMGKGSGDVFNVLVWQIEIAEMALKLNMRLVDSNMQN